MPEIETAKNTALLSELIKVKYTELGLDLPQLVYIPRSGLEIAGTMCRHLGLGAASILLAGVEKVSDPNSDSNKHEFKIGQFPREEQINLKHVLIVDVVCRSGETLNFVTKQLREFGAASVKSAVIYDMTSIVGNEADRQFKPDHYIQNGHTLGYAIFHWEWEERMAEIELNRGKARSS